MATDLERLVVSLEASITKYERAMNKAVGEARSTSRKIEKEFAGLDKKMSGMFRAGLGGLTTGLLAGAGAFLSIEGAIQGANDALDHFGHLADVSAAAGMDPEFLQGIAYQASLAGVELDELAGAMSTFAKNSALAAEGHGKLRTQLQYLNPELLKSIQLANTQEERFRLVVDALSKTSNEADRIALSTAVFGEAGAKLAGAFKGGLTDLDEMMAKAKELGLIIDRDVIAHADEIGDDFDRATQIVDLKLKQAFINLSPYLLNLVSMTGDWLLSLGIVLDQLKAIEDRQFIRPLQNELANLYNEMGPVKDRIAEIQGELAGGGPNAMILKLDLRDAQAKLDVMTAHANELLNRITELQGRPSSSSPPPPPPPPPHPVVDPEQVAAYEKEQQAVKDLISDLEHEQEVLGMTAVQQEVSNTLRKAGATATAEQKARIEELVEANYYEEQQVRALQDAYAQLWAIGEGALNSLIDAMADGTVTGNELLSVVSDITKQLGSLFIKNAFSSMSGGGGFDFASLFTGRAEGGPVEAGHPYVVGERRPELFVPRTAGRIIPQVPAAGGGVTNITIDARGAQMGVAEQIATALERFERFRMPGKVKQINRDPYAVG